MKFKKLRKQAIKSEKKFQQRNILQKYKKPLVYHSGTELEGFTNVLSYSCCLAAIICFGMLPPVLEMFRGSINDGCPMF